jgi:hypothetical protein
VVILEFGHGSWFVGLVLGGGSCFMLRDESTVGERTVKREAVYSQYSYGMSTGPLLRNVSPGHDRTTNYRTPGYTDLPYLPYILTVHCIPVRVQRLGRAIKLAVSS